MSYQEQVKKLSPEIVAQLRRAIEIGKWPDGRRVTDEQRANCMEAVLNWELVHLPEEQRTGYIDRSEKKDDEVCATDHHHDDEQMIETLMTWVDHDGAKH
jgi:uncharacterized protein YeaC (DUF1315 family)